MRTISGGGSLYPSSSECSSEAKVRTTRAPIVDKNRAWELIFANVSCIFLLVMEKSPGKVAILLGALPRKAAMRRWPKRILAVLMSQGENR